MRSNVTGMRVAGNEEGKGGMAMAMVKRMIGKKEGDSNKEGSGNGNKGGE
jgi:hypothetical protein